MANVGGLVVDINADSTGLNKGIDKAGKGISSFAKIAAVGATAAITALGAIAKKSIDLAKEQERAEARLASIAKTVTKATDEQIQSLKNLAAAQQQVSTFGDEVLIAGQSQLLSFGLQTDQVEQLTGSLADLLAANKGVNATQDDAINAANLLGKAFSGQAGALSRVGILLDESQAEILKNGDAAEKTAALVDIMNQNYGGLAETLSQTTEGQMKQFQNALGDIGEEIGEIFLPVLNQLTQFLLANMPTIRAVAVGTFEAITTVVSVVYELFSQNILPILTVFYEFIMANMPQIQEFVQTAFSVIVQWAQTFWKFYSGNLIPIVMKFFEVVKEAFPQFMSVAKEAFDVVVDVAKILWDVFETLLLPALTILFNTAYNNFPAFAKFAVGAFQAVIDVAKTVVSIIKTVINTIKAATAAVKDFFSASSRVESGGNFGGGGTSSILGVTPEGKTVRTTNPAVASTLSGARANGGSVVAGSSYLVGERGAEIFTPSSSGMITPNNKMGMGGTTNITINVQGSDPYDTADEIVRILNAQGVLS